jgi:hypothetical protein
MDGFSIGVFAILAAISGPAGAGPTPDKSATVAAPVFKAGDTWVFDQTTEKGQTGFSEGRTNVAVERVDGDTMLVGLKRDGSPTGYVDSIMGSDWSRRLLVDGQERVTNRPFAFPMSVGQSWTADWDDIRRGNVLSNHVHRTCTATGWEDVTVPAGAFHALKVVCKGVEDLTVEVPAQAVAGTVAGSGGATSVAHAQKGGQAKVTHPTYSEAYYVPELKNYVKVVDETYNAGNVRLSRTTGVLVSFKPGT